MSDLRPAAPTPSQRELNQIMLQLAVRCAGGLPVDEVLQVLLAATATARTLAADPVATKWQDGCMCINCALLRAVDGLGMLKPSEYADPLAPGPDVQMRVFPRGSTGAEVLDAFTTSEGAAMQSDARTDHEPVEPGVYYQPMMPHDWIVVRQRITDPTQLAEVVAVPVTQPDLARKTRVWPNSLRRPTPQPSTRATILAAAERLYPSDEVPE
jgi:hypothetical protein